MADRADITPELLRQLLDYNPETGTLTWKTRTPDMFCAGQKTKEHQCNMWNSKNAGKEAITARDFKGYTDGKVCNLKFKGHRLAWAIYTGKHPHGQIDHINGNPSDNRICNLRDVDALENARNLGLSKSNKTGVSGVWFVKNLKKWRAVIRVGGMAHHLGYFTTIEEAAEARRQAAIHNGFHPNHGARDSYFRRG